MTMTVIARLMRSLELMCALAGMYAPAMSAAVPRSIFNCCGALVR